MNKNRSCPESWSFGRLIAILVLAFLTGISTGCGEEESGPGVPAPRPKTPPAAKTQPAPPPVADMKDLVENRGET